MESGITRPETENWAFDTFAWLMLTGMLPVFATETAWETFLPTTALPKLTLAGFTWMAAIEFDPLAFTIPEQPLKNAAEELKITALAAHTHPLRLVFTVLISSGLWAAR